MNKISRHIFLLLCFFARLTNIAQSPYTYTVPICLGSTSATLEVPYLYSAISWIAPPASPISQAQSTMSLLTLTNALPGNVYTLTMLNNVNSNTYTILYLIQTNTISTIVGTNSTCPNGASGSATVLTNVPGINYNYSWVNSNNITVSTNSFAPNLSAGLYSVTVSAPNFSSCGVSTSTLMIGTAPYQTSTILAMYCNGGEAYLGLVPWNTLSNATNFQWYNSTVAIPASQGGTAPTYTVLSPTNYSILYSLAYTTSQGCRDSAMMILQVTPPGSITVISATPACQSVSNGIITLSVMPTFGASFSSPFSYFIAQNTGTPTPAYIYSNSPISYQVYTLSNLSASGVYSLTAFDGVCKYSVTHSVNAISFDFTLSPNPIINICAGTNSIVQAITSGSQSSYTYSWSPSTFIANPAGQITTITPTTVSGSSVNIIYSIVVSPTINNCPLTKTLSVSVYHPVTPTLITLPTYCANAGTIDISASTNPTGGIFYFNAYSNNGLLNTSLSNGGTNTYTYVNFMGNCSANATGTYTINASPQISVASTTNVICQGSSVTLNANGANSYTWNNGAQTSSIIVSPTSTTQYYISGTDENGCTGNAPFTVNVSSPPLLNVSGTFTFCSLQMQTLTVSGAYSYLWQWNATAWATSSFLIVNPAVTNQYTVTGTSTIGCISTKVVTITIVECLDIGELKVENEELKVYPTPGNGKFIIETSMINYITITDVSGKIIFEKQLQTGKHEIDLSNFSNGIYFVKTSTNWNKKIVKAD